MESPNGRCTGFRLIAHSKVRGTGDLQPIRAVSNHYARNLLLKLPWYPCEQRPNPFHDNVQSMDDSELTLTLQLRRFSEGDRAMAELILRAVLPKLHEVAVRALSKERFAAPLSATELINEVWIRHLRSGGFEVRNREHFYAIAGKAMRRVLVDFARKRLAVSRGVGDVPLSLEVVHERHLQEHSQLEQIIEIGRLMEVLEKRDPVGARIFELRYFTGFTLEEVAEITGLTKAQVRHLWNKTEAWIKDRFGN